MIYQQFYPVNYSNHQLYFNWCEVWYSSLHYSFFYLLQSHNSFYFVQVAHPQIPTEKLWMQFVIYRIFLRILIYKSSRNKCRYGKHSKVYFVYIYLFSTWYDAKSAKCVLDRDFMQYFWSFSHSNIYNYLDFKK